MRAINDKKATILESDEKVPLLEVCRLRIGFPQFLKGFEETFLQVISNFNVKIDGGQILGVVGASGSGKSLLADAIFGILPENALVDGNLYYRGEELSVERQKALRGKELFLIPQSVKSLDPLMKVGKQVQRITTRQPITKQDVKNIFSKMKLPAETIYKYPFELSGGMARRVLIAMAVLSDAKLIIADEPTPGLDTETRDIILAEIKKLATHYGKSVLFITHDIEAALKIADKITVFNKGETIEVADVSQFSGRGEKLKKTYTKDLWNALPENGFLAGKTENI